MVRVRVSVKVGLQIRVRVRVWDKARLGLGLELGLEISRVWVKHLPKNDRFFSLENNFDHYRYLLY
jgi:hypothetical protein